MKRIAGFSLLLIALAATGLAQQDHNVPEIDPGSITAAAALVGVGLMMVRGRRKQQ